jgi:D-alanine-D-alanine ligase-like ATP-grasp enzyme
MKSTCFVKALHQASLFCDTSCILTSFFSEGETSPQQHIDDQKAWRITKKQLSLIDIDLAANPIDLEGDVPGVVLIMKSVVDGLLEPANLFCESSLVQQDKKNDVFRLITVHKNQALTLHLVSICLRFVSSIYANLSKVESSPYLKEIDYLLKNQEALGASRSIREIRMALEKSETPWIPLDKKQHLKEWIQLGFGKQQKIIDDTITFDSSHLGVMTTLSKINSRNFLAELGFPVPRQSEVLNLAQAIKRADVMGFPVVLKADIGAYGIFVHSDLRNPEDLKRAFRLLAKNLKDRQAQKVFIEEHISGNIYRLEVVEKSYFDAFHMIPAHITGDGSHSIKELVDIENKSPNRVAKNDNYGLYLKLTLNEEDLLNLKKEGLGPSDIPKQGQRVLLSSNSNWSRGGTFERCSSNVHPDNILLVERIAKCLDIGILGIDVASSDISKSYLECPLKVIEVNHTPTMVSYINAETGESNDIGNRLINRLTKGIEYGDVPVIMTKESAKSQETFDLIEMALDNFDFSPGRTGPSGISINGKTWSTFHEVQQENPSLQLLRNPEIGSALVERPIQNFAEYGVGAGGCDLAIIHDLKETNISVSLFPKGVSSLSIDQMLANSARLKTIIVLNSYEEWSTFKKLDIETPLVILPKEGEQWIREEGSSISTLFWNVKADHQIEVLSSLDHNQGTHTLNTPKMFSPISILTVIASLWLLKVENQSIMTWINSLKESP